MFNEITRVWAAVSIAFLGGSACWVLDRLGMDKEAKSLQTIVVLAMIVIFLRYVAEVFLTIQTFGRY